MLSLFAEASFFEDLTQIEVEVEKEREKERTRVERPREVMKREEVAEVSCIVSR